MTYGEKTIETALANAEKYWKSSALQNQSAPVIAAVGDRKTSKMGLNDSLLPIEISTDPFPPLLKEYLDTLSKKTKADKSMILSAILCCVSSFVKKNRFLAKDEGYFQPLYPNLWTLSVSESGNFKTTSIRLGAELSYEHDALIHPQENELPLEPHDLKKLTLLTNYQTAEGLLRQLSYGAGGLISSGEFGAWFASIQKKYNEGLEQLLLELYDVPLMLSKVTVSQGTIVVREPFISICGMTTPVWVKQWITEERISSGFLPRFLIFYPPDNDDIPDALPRRILHPTDKKDQLYEILKKIAKGKPKSLIFSEDAHAEFWKYHEQMYMAFRNVDRKADRIVKPFLKRWSPYLAKVAMIMQVFIDPDADEICMDALIAAEAVIDYVMHSTRILLSKEIGESPHQKKQRLVMEYIDKRGGSVDFRKLQQSHTLDGGMNDYLYVVESMESAGYVSLVRNDNGKIEKIIKVTG